VAPAWMWVPDTVIVAGASFFTVAGLAPPT